MTTSTLTQSDLRVLRVQFTGQLYPREVTAFRGAIGHKVGPEAVLFHHHEGDRLRFAYPLIQYKSIAGRPTIICLGPGVDDIHRFFSHPDWSIQVHGRELPMRIEKLNLTPWKLSVSGNQMQAYQLSHWIALNQRSFGPYQALTGLAERIQFLERKLVGNILSFAKGVGWHIDQQIHVEITDLEEARPIRIKGIALHNFHVHFSSNVSLPHHIGLGGKVSVGMGVVDSISR